MKGLLKGLLILLVVAGLVAGGIYGYSRYTLSQPCEVQPVGNWLLEYSPNQTYLGGSVTSGQSLILYGEKDRMPLEIFVAEGQTVRVGDPLVRYDTTKANLDLDEKRLDRQKLYDSLEAMYKEYRRYAYVDYERTVPTATPSPSPTPRNYQGVSAESRAVLSVQRLSAPVQRALQPPAGQGTWEDPYRFGIAEGDPIPEALLMDLQAQANRLHQTVYAVFATETGSLDMRFMPPSADDPQGSAVFTAYKAPWTAPRTATATAQLMDVTPFGKGTLASPFLYPYTEGTEVPWTFLSFCCRRAAVNGRYLYVQLVGAKTGDMLISLDCTSMGTYLLRLEKTPSCTVTFDSNGGSSVSAATVTYGSAYGKLPVPTREEYIFSGWWTARDTGGTQATDQTLVTKSHTLYARWKPVPTPTPSATPEETAPDGTPEPTPTPYVPYYGMSWAERRAYVQELAQQIRSEEIRYRQLCHDIDLLTASAENGTVTSTIDGVVSRMDPAAKAGEPLLEIRGGSGKNVISCMLGETELDKYPVGTELTGFNYEIGDNVTARVTYVSSMPVTESYSSGGNPNASGYTMLLEVQGDLELPLYSYVEFTSFEPLSKPGAIYLYEAFVREIDGQDCIFVVRDGVLKKEQVHTGRRTMEYIELIGSDLVREDYIAFPYGKNVRDGASVVITDGDW